MYALSMSKPNRIYWTLTLKPAHALFPREPRTWIATYRNALAVRSYDVDPDTRTRAWHDAVTETVRRNRGM